MSHYQFTPEKSFLAKLYWRTTDFIPDPPVATREMRIGTMTSESSIGIEGWLHAGVDNYSAKPRNPWSDDGRHKFKTQFWFGCYETDGEHDYEIRAAGSDENTYLWEYRNHRLDISRNGYLGLYPTSDEPGHDAFGARSMIWRLEGFPTDGLAPGMVLGPVQLTSLHGKVVKRFMEAGVVPYLNEDKGEDGWLLVEILAVGVARP